MFGSKDTPIIEIIDIINESGIRHAFIINEEKQLLGIVGDGDIRRAILKDIPLSTPVEKIMIKNPVVARTSMSKSEILDLMLQKWIMLIPVVDENNRFVDFYQITDFIKKEYLTSNIDTDVKSNIYKTYKKVKVMIIGGAGYIGSVLSRVLLEYGFKVRVLDKLLFGEESIEDLLNNPNFEFIKGDFRDFDVITPALEGIDTIVHLAAIVGDPACKVDPELTNDVNYHSVKVLGSLCKYYNIKNFIFFSTCSVYGMNDSLITEETEPNPLSLYAEAKLNAEKALISLKDENFRPIILRLATVFGLSPRMRFDLAINIMTAMSIQNGYINIFSGNQWRPFVHVLDVSKIILKIINLPKEDFKHDIYNLGFDSNNIQIKDIGQIIKNILPETEVRFDMEKEDDRSYKISFERLKNVIGISKALPIEHGIREIEKFLRTNDIDFKQNRFINVKNFKYSILCE